MALMLSLATSRDYMEQMEPEKNNMDSRFGGNTRESSLLVSSYWQWRWTRLTRNLGRELLILKLRRDMVTAAEKNHKIFRGISNGLLQKLHQQ